MRGLTFVVLIMSLGLFVAAGCASKSSEQPAAARSAGAADDNPVIVHVVSRNQTVTISSGPKGLLYSLKSADGKVLVADATGEEFRRREPALYENILHYIAVQNDEAPIPAASITGPTPDARLKE